MLFIERFELLKSNHENVVKSHQTMFEKHNNEIQKLENIQNQNLEKQIKDFEDTKTSIKVLKQQSYYHVRRMIFWIVEPHPTQFI